MRKQKVLFICVHNSARSQMAAALLNQTCGEFFEAQVRGYNQAPSIHWSWKRFWSSELISPRTQRSAFSMFGSRDRCFSL